MGACSHPRPSNDTPVIPRESFMLIAHRGASAYAPENTLSALKKAMALGANFLEIDVHQSLDHEIVAIHDDTVDRTTNGIGRVADLTLSEIKRLDAGFWFNATFLDTRIPTLREVINILKPGTKLIIDVKGDSTSSQGIEKRIAAIIQEKQFETQVVFKSFNLKTLARFQAIMPQVPRLYVFVRNTPALNFTIDGGLHFGNIYENPTKSTLFQAHQWFLNHVVVKKAQAEKIKMIAWQVNTKKEIQAILALGVDGIETDYPDRVLQFLD